MPSKSKSKPARRTSRPIAKKSPATKGKTSAKKVSPSAAAAKKRPAAKARRDARAKATRPKLLSGGNPQIAMANGDAPVQAYIAAIPGWKRDIARRIDALVVRTVPGVRKAVKWNSPFYGIEGQGWFLAFHVFTNYVKVTYFSGTSLQPAPSGGTGQGARWIDVHEDDMDEAQLANWIRQAAALPGFLAPRAAGRGTRNTGRVTRVVPNKNVHPLFRKATTP